MLALHFKRHSLSRLLLSLPGLDTSIRNEVNNTALQKACYKKAPLDIVTTLARLSTLETINMKNNYGDTALMTSLSGFNSTCLVVATRNSISRMLLSVPGLDTNTSNKDSCTALHKWPASITPRWTFWSLWSDLRS